MTTEDIIADANKKMAELKKLIPGDLEVCQKIQECINGINFIENSFIYQKPSFLVCTTKKVYLHILDWRDSYQDIKVTEDMYYAIRDSMLIALDAHVKEAEHYIKFLSQR